MHVFLKLNKYVDITQSMQNSVDKISDVVLEVQVTLHLMQLKQEVELFLNIKIKTGCTCKIK